ncbi:MAG: hypothetical protein AB1815_10060 [Bacillota bacterium]
MTRRPPGRLFITELIRPKTPASAGGGGLRAVKSSMDSADIQRGLNPPLNEVSFKAVEMKSILVRRGRGFDTWSEHRRPIKRAREAEDKRRICLRPAGPSYAAARSRTSSSIYKADSVSGRYQHSTILLAPMPCPVRQT